MNLTVFEAALPEDWRILTFSDPFKALEALEHEKPWVIVSDQRMPGITGVKFLELAKKLHPNSVRIVVTGYSEEDLVVESVRKAQVYDYIKKPWEPEEVEASIRRAISLYQATEEAKRLHDELIEREATLRAQNIELSKLTSELKLAHHTEIETRKELECWAPPFLLEMLSQPGLKFPFMRDLVGITFDMVNSSSTHDIYIQGRPLRAIIIQIFSEILLRYGGWRESHAGDSAYGHFGLWDQKLDPVESALASAREFRIALRNFCGLHSINVECGISLHLMKQSVVNLHAVQILGVNGPITVKSFDTNSAEVDLLHRLEKLVHKVPGTNIVMTEDFVRAMKAPPAQMISLGAHRFSGRSEPIGAYLLPSDQVTEAHVQEIREGNGALEPSSKAA